MFSVVASVAIVVLGQYPIYQQQPVYVQPVCQVYHDIHFPDVVRTRVDVEAVMPDGSRFPIPILNGYKPEITITQNLTSIRRVFTYKDRDKWAGNRPLIYAKTKPKKLVPKPKPKLVPVVKPKPKPKPPILNSPSNSRTIIAEIKRVPSSIKSKEADFTKKFPRY
jgi:hypothetical protein